MHMPPGSSSAATLLKVYGVYHLTRLQADKKVKELADGFAQSQERLQAKVDAYEAASISAMRTQAIRDGEDAALDAVVRRFYATLLVKHANNRRSPEFERYFPQGMGRVVNAPLDNELMKVGSIIGQLAEEEDADLAAFAELLSAAADNLRTAMNANLDAQAAEANAIAKVKAEKINWLDSYKLDYRELARLYYKEKGKADTYFKKAAKKAQKDTPAPSAV